MYGADIFNYLFTQSEIQYFRILHRIIPCNKWLNMLNTITIKNSDQCSYCARLDDIPHIVTLFKMLELLD